MAQRRLDRGNWHRSRKWSGKSNWYRKRKYAQRSVISWRTKKLISGAVGFFVRSLGVYVALGALILLYMLIVHPVPSGNTLNGTAALSAVTGDEINRSESYKSEQKFHKYIYYLDGRKSISYVTSGGLSDYFSKESHTYRYNYVQEVILELFKNSYQDEYLEPFISQIRKASSSPDTQARIAISLVQHIPYSWDKYAAASSDWYYPYETLHNDQGVCSDKSLLLAYILNKLGCDAVLFEFSDHMAVGVKCDDQYDFKNSGYAFVESTRPTIITYIPENYVNGFRITSSGETIHLQGGTKSLDVSEEYRDAQELKRIESMGQVLDEYNYARWQSLTKKYDLDYDN